MATRARNHPVIACLVLAAPLNGCLVERTVSLDQFNCARLDDVACRKADAGTEPDSSLVASDSGPTFGDAEPRDFGTRDSGGTRDGGGTSTLLPYAPTNFDPVEIPEPAIGGNEVFNCGASSFNSTTLGFSGWCQTPSIRPIVVLQQGGPDVVLLAMRELSVEFGATLSFTGSRPVVLIVLGDASIKGVVDVSAVGATSGAGVELSDCEMGAGRRGTYTPFSALGGGGGGGGYGSAGAHGGDPNYGGFGGTAFGTAELRPLRGGCPGAVGVAVETPGLGGGAGGALQLSVGGTLRVEDDPAIVGGVYANGGGGQSAFGTNVGNGGGGGGSGGAILLEADRIVLAGPLVIAANGGGGGGGSAQGGPAGTRGSDGRVESTAPAPGGQGLEGFGNGGSGAAGGTPAAAGSVGGSGQASIGAGGAGGGIGRIRINAISGCTVGPDVAFSPTPTSNGAPGCP
ncbi:MAG: hypothetical protein HYV07_26815 [Deltaproteobacteria bacterium]|nr:hypothetical protein [Deltaproteobacteria bacterium]